LASSKWEDIGVDKNLDKRLAEKYVAIVSDLMADEPELVKSIEWLSRYDLNLDIGYQLPGAFTDQLMLVVPSWLTLQLHFDFTTVAAICWVWHAAAVAERFYRGRVSLVHQRLGLGGDLIRRGRPRRPGFQEFLLCCDRLTNGRSDRRRFYREFRDLAEVVFGLKMSVDVFQRAIMKLRAERRAARRSKLKLVKKAG
jgi:hypothetical protein